MFINRKKVAWCPECEQGWIEIAKDLDTGELFCCCDECMCEWNDPNNITPQTVVACAKRGIWGKACDPTDEEIATKGWQKFIIHEYQGHRID